MSIQTSITIPDDLAAIIEMLEIEKGRSKSQIIIYLIEKGIVPAMEEINKIETVKSLIEKKTKENSLTSNSPKNDEDNGKSKPRGSSKTSKGA
ncbi:hypothetical protein ACP6PL_10380 [Dapis sp. BLCC M126]|uniref:hypothetical protein n=1 Tax=Dapis sp. BLCC M126 TaxID=3400189 RepID=UPI003CF679A8